MVVIMDPDNNSSQTDSLPTPIEPPGEELTIKTGDSAKTRSVKRFLTNLSWEQKISFATLTLIALALPLSLAAVSQVTRLFPQAATTKNPKVYPGLTPVPETTPTPTPTPRLTLPVAP